MGVDARCGVGASCLGRGTPRNAARRAARWAGRRDDGDVFVRRVAGSDELAPARRRAPIVIVDERWWGWDHLASHHSRAD